MKDANISVTVTKNIVIHLVSLNSKITSEPRANPHKQNFAFRIGFYWECFELTTSSYLWKFLVIFRFLRFKRNSKQEGKKIRKKTAKY